MTPWLRGNCLSIVKLIKGRMYWTIVICGLPTFRFEVELYQSVFDEQGVNPWFWRCHLTLKILLNFHRIPLLWIEGDLLAWLNYTLMHNDIIVCTTIAFGQQSWIVKYCRGIERIMSLQVFTMDQIVLKL